MFNPYVKALIAAAVAVVAGLSTGIEDGKLTTTEVVIAIVAGITGLVAVFGASHPLVKVLGGALIAAASAFATAVLDDKVTYAEYITIVGAALGALAAISASSNSRAVDYKTVDP